VRAPLAVIAIASLGLVTPPGVAQDVRQGGRLRVFLDCQTFCDESYIRTEILWVDWVRDREVAGVHVLVTSEGTGGGGRRYRLDFLGRGPLEGLDRRLSFSSSGDATDDEVRQGVTRVLGVGLVGYAGETPEADRLSVAYRALEPGAVGSEALAGSVDDPWDFWVFRLGLNGNLGGESQTRYAYWNGTFSANRTTEAWKVNARAAFSRDENEYELTQGKERYVTEDWNLEGFVVKSLGEHWSAGVRSGTGSSTYLNQHFRWSLHPGVEYDLFPYAETTRRALTFQYLVGLDHWDYEEETVYDRTSETRASHSLTVGLDLTQPWGQSDVALRGSQYFHDTSKYSVTLSGRVEWRIVRGLSFNVGGRYSWIRDQLGIRKGDLEDDEILTQLRELETDFRYFTFFGISYRFGSIFNNVVNPRFGDSGSFF
jgi:hypothetical protein